MIDEQLAFYADWAAMNDCRPYMDEIEVGWQSLRLRRMLVDAHPLVHIVNKIHRQKILFPASPLIEVKFSDRICVYRFPKDLFSVNQAFSSSLDKFLSHKIIQVDKFCFSIREAIKIVANNLGGVHFDHNKTNKEHQLNFKQPTMVKAMQMVIYHIAKATSAGLRPLADSCFPFPDHRHFLGRYKPAKVKHKTISIENHQWMECKYPENTITPNLSILAVLEPLPQALEKATILSFALRDAANVSLALSRQGDFEFSYSTNNRKVLVRLEDARRTRPIGKIVYIRASIVKKALSTVLEIEMQGRTKTKAFEFPIDALDLQRLVIGAMQNGELGASFLLHELCILSSEDKKVQADIVKYFKFRYFK